jgi:phage baseplate assembly protein W
MDEGKLLGKGISFPPRIGPDGRVTWSAGEQNIREAIRIILLTELKERLQLPEFGGGLKMFLFKPNTASTHRQMQERIKRALERWEPRIKVESVIVVKDPADEQSAVITINYKLVAKGVKDQIRITFKLKD